MPFVPFQELCPEVAENETRTLTLPTAKGGVPPGAYTFIEMYCDEEGCDEALDGLAQESRYVHGRLRGWD